MFDVDVAVIGAGPAGLATAIAARRGGLSVISIDASHPPIDKACGEGLLPGAIRAAEHLGLDLPLEQSSPIDGIRFVQGTRTAESSFQGIVGRSFRRTALSQALATQASRCGVVRQWGSAVTAIHGHQIHTSSGIITARWIIGADGERSRVRHWAGLDQPPSSVRYGFRQHFDLRPWTRMVEVYWGVCGQVYITPLHGQQVSIAVVSRDPHYRVQSALLEFPQLRQRLSLAHAASSERGAVTTVRNLPKVVQDHVALVGDASGTVDAITGDGIGLAFQQAGLLATAIQNGDLHLYQSAHHEISRKTRWMGNALLALDRSPFLARLAIRLASGRPVWFRRLVELHAAGH